MRAITLPIPVLMLALVAPAALGQSVNWIPYVQITGLSDDGAIAVGNAGGSFGVVWTAASGKFMLNTDPPVPSYTNANAISGDGTTVVGSAGSAYRWRGPGTYESIGKLTAYYVTTAYGVSRDGSVIAGTATDRTRNYAGAFVWTQASGIVDIGRPRSDDYYTAATGVSRDGSTVVGYSNGSGNPAAFAWTASGGMHKLADLLQNNGSRAWAVNSDGSFVVGTSGIGQATIWRNGTPYSLGDVQSKSGPTQAFALSADGSIVGGAVGGANLYAAVWTPAGGQLLVDYLKTFGVLVPSTIRLERVTSISADGKTFGGWAIDSALNDYTGFVISIPSAGSVTILIGFAFVRRRPR